MKRYDFKCDDCRETFESDKPQGAKCPNCGKHARRVYSATPLYHPTRGKGGKL